MKVQGTVLNEASHLLEAPQSWNAHNSHHIHASPHHSSQSTTRSGSRSNTNAMATSFDEGGMMGGDGFSLLNNHAFLILILNCLKVGFTLKIMMISLILLKKTFD